MKTGLTVKDFANEIMRQAEAKRDIVADTRQLVFNPDGTIQVPVQDKNRIQLVNGLNEFAGTTSFKLKDIAHAQIAARLKIPKVYYDRTLVHAPDLLATNVNHWFNKEPERRLLRILDGFVRAMLSNRFRRLDNDAIAQILLKKIVDSKIDCKILCCSITDRKMYIKVIFPSISFDVKPGDKVYFGKVISNSEVGHGSLNIEDFFYRTFCDNGCTFEGGTMRKYHVGGSLCDGDQAVQELLTQKTIDATDKAFWMQLSDIWDNSTQPANFCARMEQITAAREDKIEKPLPDVVELARKEFALTEAEGKDMLVNLAAEGEHNRYGLANSITHLANSIDDYDRISDLEKLGGKVLGLSQAQWKKLAA